MWGHRCHLLYLVISLCEYWFQFNAVIINSEVNLKVSFLIYSYLHDFGKSYFPFQVLKIPSHLTRGATCRKEAAKLELVGNLLMPDPCVCCSCEMNEISPSYSSIVILLICSPKLTLPEILQESVWHKNRRDAVSYYYNGEWDETVVQEKLEWANLGHIVQVIWLICFDRLCMGSLLVASFSSNGYWLQFRYLRDYHHKRSCRILSKMAS